MYGPLIVLDVVTLRETAMAMFIRSNMRMFGNRRLEINWLPETELEITESKLLNVTGGGLCQMVNVVGH